MRNLQEATERICELKGSLVALDALTAALLHAMSDEQRARLRPVFDRHAEVARSMLIPTPISEHTIAAFERDVRRTAALIGEPTTAPRPVESVLFSTVRIGTFDGTRAMTGASGFFFERGERLFLVTSLHVLIDEESGHRPDRIEIGLHTDADDLTRSIGLSILLYRDGKPEWRQTGDANGSVDVAVLELQRSALPEPTLLHAFGPAHLQAAAGFEVGHPLLIVGFPLGFHDTLHHLPVVRQAAIASSARLRFQDRGFFLTDARTHRGTSGAPVVVRTPAANGALPWALLGVHSSRMDMGDRDKDADESLGLNCAWYADVLLELTGD
jgi:S1-C subfamily serine protease